MERKPSKKKLRYESARFKNAIEAPDSRTLISPIEELLLLSMSNKNSKLENHRRTAVIDPETDRRWKRR